MMKTPSNWPKEHGTTSTVLFVILKYGTATLIGKIDEELFYFVMPVTRLIKNTQKNETRLIHFRLNFQNGPVLDHGYKKSTRTPFALNS